MTRRQAPAVRGSDMGAALRTLLATLLLVCAASLPRDVTAEERLAMPKFPSGWVESFARRGDQEVVEYVPPGQSAITWQRKITLEIYHDLKNLPLDTLQRRAAGQNRDACDSVVEGKFQTGVNNGYASAFWTLGCRREKTSGFGETRYTKAIQGLSGLYLLSYVWRTPAFIKGEPGIAAQDIAGAMAFLTSSVVCNTETKQSPCPAGTATGAGPGR